MFRRAFCLLFLLGFLSACDLSSPPTPTTVPVTPTTVAALPSATTVAVAPTPALPSPTVAPLATATTVPAPATATVPPATDTISPVAATATAPAEAVSPTAGRSPTALSSPEATAEPTTQAQLQTIESETADLRGLQPKTTVPAHFITAAQMAANTKQEELTDYPASDATRDALELWLLRLLDDRGTDLRQLQIDLLGEQVIGYYSPDDKELFVRNDQQPLGPDAETTLAHEFTHALQDQYYDLNKLRPKDLHDNDKGTAVTALIEGDAVLSQTLFDFRYLTQAQLQQLENANPPSPELDKAPAYIRDSLLFPYNSGLLFVLTLYREAGNNYSLVNQAFRDPPDTSEQILHPDRYLATPRDEALPITLPPLTSTLGAGWTLKDTNDLGEFDLAEMLQVNSGPTPTPVPPDNLPTAPTVDGWGGSRYAVYQGPSNAALMLLITRWDSTGAANSFTTRLRTSFGGATTTGALWTDHGRIFGFTHTGDQVVYVSGTDEGTVNRVLAAVK